MTPRGIKPVGTPRQEDERYARQVAERAKPRRRRSWSRPPVGMFFVVREMRKRLF